MVDTMNQNDLINAMTNKDLETYKAKFKDNPKVAEYIDGILAGRAKIAEQVKAEADFAVSVAKIANLPTPPASIHNVHIAWAEVDDTTKPETVKVDGKPDEVRFPKVWKWVVTTNHADKVSRGDGTEATSKTTSRKLAITVDKRNGQALELIGRFRNGAEACNHLKLEHAGNSAIRVLRDNGYIVADYDGTDFTIKAN